MIGDIFYFYIFYFFPLASNLRWSFYLQVKHALRKLAMLTLNGEISTYFSFQESLLTADMVII